MKKRVSALALALALCLGLAAPALAADVTGTAAAAYANVLEDQISQYGIQDAAADLGIEYADVLDMDADGTAELLLIRKSGTFSQNVSIWTMDGNSAVQTLDWDTPEQWTLEGTMAYARKNGQVQLFLEYKQNYSVYDFHYINLLDADGTVYESSSSTGQEKPAQVTYDKSWVVDSTPISTVAGDGWSFTAAQKSGVTSLQKELEASTQNASHLTVQGSRCTVSGVEYDGSPFTAVFETTGVEKKTVTETFYGPEGNTEVTKVQATVISVRPGSTIQLEGGVANHNYPILPGEKGIRMVPGPFDGTNFTADAGASEASYVVAGPVSDTFRNGSEGSGCYLLSATDNDGDRIYLYLDTGAAAVGGFTDVKEGDYFADAVLWAVEKDITTGTGASTFSPDKTCTTAEILTFLWRASGSPAPAGSNPFSDVADGAYYADAAVWAYEEGLVSGETFGGDVPCTRAATVTYLWKLAGQPDAGTAGFTDVPGSADYAKAVAWAVEQEITSGTGNGAFSPDMICSRGQIVTFLYRDMAQ